MDSYEPDYSRLKGVVSVYNPGEKYADSVIQILHVLKKYAGELFI
ncbi:MAG: hypothetical protein UT50_C0025G0005 [Candidatus Moranbacteria bacterium GW2011_GWA2_39_41]|nr:MAG: hypothetical protein UT50_C0025G0005 [Candidatus Moranbacteria bacterium GW2011_GWA2_39_41]